jgi:alternate signal-mediated exported protein
MRESTTPATRRASAAASKKRRRLGFAWVAGAGLLALTFGGGTYALWSASDTLAGGTVIAGDLNLDCDQDKIVWSDASSDRTDAGHTITDIATWRMVPGDKIAGSASCKLTLEGDNLTADLKLTVTPDPEVELQDVTGLVGGSTVLKVDGQTYTASMTAGGTIARFEAHNGGQGLGQPDGSPTVVPLSAKEVNVTVDFELIFDGTTVTGRMLAGEALASLGDLNLSLEQVREGPGFSPAP